jgi:hypothetical protein
VTPSLIDGAAVPVTAKLSRLFYERFGEQIANELVDWFNAVDATYRSDLRELNEINFARFEAKLEQRLAEFRAELVTMFEKRFVAIEGRLSTLEREMQLLRSEVRGDMKALEARLVKWMFLFWAGTALAGLLLR